MDLLDVVQKILLSGTFLLGVRFQSSQLITQFLNPVFQDFNALSLAGCNLHSFMNVNLL
jgi:hypothetical protein